MERQDRYMKAPHGFVFLGSIMVVAFEPKEWFREGPFNNEWGRVGFLWVLPGRLLG